MLAGHNRGKVFIKGEGYRYPTKKSVEITHNCVFCGERATVFFSDGTKCCESCSVEYVK